uniref:Uncharacterized protein n=1 Tax=Glossina pallidipes TaxID=7398 RepID=A0A1B0A2M2_GLOPL
MQKNAYSIKEQHCVARAEDKDAIFRNLVSCEIVLCRYLISALGVLVDGLETPPTRIRGWKFIMKINNYFGSPGRYAFEAVLNNKTEIEYKHIWLVAIVEYRTSNVIDTVLHTAQYRKMFSSQLYFQCIVAAKLAYIID